MFTNPRFFVMWVMVVMFSICCHEFAHAWVALREGDSTARDLGHLSLNPLRQMGPMSIFMLVLIGIAWGAVPTIPRNFRSKWSQLFVSAAGPGMNFVLSAIFVVVYVVVSHFGSVLGKEIQFAAQQLFYIGIMLNIVLGIFNLCPIPPLDGWNVWGYVFPFLTRLDESTKRVVFYLGIMVLIFSFGIFWGIGRGATELILRLTGSSPVDILAGGAS